jgi:hypothetical protein
MPLNEESGPNPSLRNSVPECDQMAGVGLGYQAGNPADPRKLPLLDISMAFASSF